MASLAGAITFLALSGTPGLATYTAAAAGGSPRPDDGQFTALQVYGTSGKPQTSFTDKTVETVSTKVVTDTYIVRLTLGSVEGVDAEVSDLYVPVLTLSAYPTLSKVVSDTYVPRLTLAKTALVQSGTIAKSGADTYVPVLTLSASLTVQIGVSDTYVPVLTLANTALDQSDVRTVADSYVPVLTMTVQTLAKINAAVSKSVSDTYVPRLTLNATVAYAGEVDNIRITTRPKGRIRIRTV